MHSYEERMKAVQLFIKYDLSAVSYTHLDVYKRQALHLSANKVCQKVKIRGFLLQS